MTQAFTTEQLEQATKAATKQAEDFMSFGKNSFDAWMKSSNIMMDGASNLMKDLTAISEKSREKQAAAMKQMMSCKNMNDMTEVSTRLSQETLEDTMSLATTLSERTIKLCMDSAEPLNDTMSKNAQSMQKKAKAA